MQTLGSHSLSIFLYLFLRLDISLAIVLSLSAELRSISRFTVAVVKVELLAFLRMIIGKLSYINGTTNSCSNKTIQVAIGDFI